MDTMTEDVRCIALSLMEELNCPRSLAIYMMIKADDLSQVVKLTCEPRNYASASAYLSAVSATDFLRKVEVKLPGLDPKEAALQKWWAAERDCFKTNQRFNEMSDFGTLNGEPIPERLREYFARVRKIIRDIIGRPPDVFEGFFGPGATVSDRSGVTSVPHKLSSVPTVTPCGIFYLVPWSGTKWGAAFSSHGKQIQSSRGNHFFTVPKNALTDRACAKEPSINSFYQLGCGRLLRQRLKRSGIDLQRGQDLHRELARRASITGEFATIDLSSASDTVATALVRALLPHSWFSVLDDLRSKLTKVGESWVRLEKFSSMGNGFTFELETLVFLALILGLDDELVAGENVFVYGDDLIVPTKYAPLVLSALKFCGFTPNPSKTFTEGPFRESCGGDFWNGAPVRPFNLESIPNAPSNFISLANGIRRLAKNFCQDTDIYFHLRRTWFKCLDSIPRHVRQCRGPEMLGDLVIHDTQDRWFIRWRANGIRYVRVWRPHRFNTVSFNRFCPDTQMAAALYGVAPRGVPKDGWPEGFDNRPIVLRGDPLSYKVGWVPCS